MVLRIGDTVSWLNPNVNLAKTQFAPAPLSLSGRFGRYRSGLGTTDLTRGFDQLSI